MHPSIKTTISLLIRHHKRIAFAIVFLLLLENSVLVYDNIQNKKPILGLKILGKTVTGYSREQIQALAQKEFEKNQRPLKLSYGNKIFEIKPHDVAATVDYKSFANSVLLIGRQGNVFQKILEQNKALFGLKNIPIRGKISRALLTIAVLDIQKQVDHDAIPSSPDLNNPKNILRAREGIKINADKLAILILSNIFDPPQNPIAITTYKMLPNPHSKEEIARFQKEIQGYSFDSISIASGGLVFTISSKELKSFLTVSERPDSKDPKKSVLVIRFDEGKLNKRLGDFAQKVENVTDAEFDDHDARIAIFSQFFSNSRRVIAIPTGRFLANRGRKVLGAQTQTGQKTVYLTFDDGPNSIYHPLILDILKTYHVQATFFLVGQNAQRDSVVAQRTVTEGHVIGNHSLTHSFLPNYASSFILNELQSTDNILKSINGSDIRLFRPPYGGVNAYVTQNAQNLGLKMFLWDVDPRDWAEPETSDLVQRVVSNVFDGADVLMHSNHLATVKALPKIIENLQAQGYIFRSLPQ